MSEVKVEKFECKTYYKKARGFLEGAEILLEKGYPTQAFSQALHAFILYLDALNIADLGVRSSSQNHMETLATYKKVQINEPQRAEKKKKIMNFFIRYIKEKNAVEYTDEEFSAGKVQEMLSAIKDVDAFVKKELEERGFYTL